MENKLCDYGCGNDSKFLLNNNKNCCSETYQKCPSIRKKNSDNNKMNYDKNIRIYNKETMYKDSQAWRRGKTFLDDNRINIKHKISEFFIVDSKVSRERVKEIILLKRLIKYECNCCGIIDEWNGKNITLELDHINGIRNDNRLENLRFLCPNCHSQTPTYRSKNNRKNIVLNEDDVINKIKNGYSIHRILKEAGLADAGNYNKIYKILSKHNINYEFKNKMINKKTDKSIKIKNEKTNICLCCNQEFIEKKGKKYCSVECYKIDKRKVIPLKDEIIEAFKKYNTFVGVGKYFNVSDNAVRKWCISYKILDIVK